MVVKGNQRALRSAIALLFARRPAPGDDLRMTRQVNKGHGRVETRTLYASVDLNAYLDWPGLAQVLCLERTFYYPKQDKTLVERDYGITSLRPDQIDLNTVLTRWREHWAIENKAHWVRDVIMGEDASRVRTGTLPQVLAALRNAAISLVKALGHTSVKAARRHFALDLHLALACVCDPLE